MRKAPARTSPTQHQAMDELAAATTRHARAETALPRPRALDTDRRLAAAALDLAGQARGAHQPLHALAFKAQAVLEAQFGVDAWRSVGSHREVARVRYVYLDADVEVTWEPEREVTWQMYTDREFEARPGPQCGRCPFAHVCPDAGRVELGDLEVADDVVF